MNNKKLRPMAFIRKLLGKDKKRKKKTPPDDVIYSPAEDLNTMSRIVGMGMRALILFLGIFGFTAFICDAFEFTVAGNSRFFCITNGYMILVSLLVSAVCGLWYYSEKTRFIVPPAAAALYMGICAAMYGNPFSFIYYCGVRMLNYACYTMVLRGYTYFGDFMIGDGLDYSLSRYMTGDPYRSGGVLLLAIVIGIFLAPAIMKKVRFYILIPFMAVCIYPILTYNMITGKTGFAFIIAFCVAAVSLYVYDYRFAGGLMKHQEKVRRKLEKAEAKRAEKEKRAEEKKKLREEADKMLLAALSADMGRKRSKLARKAVFKAAKRAKKEAKKDEKLRKKREKKEARAAAKAAKAENARLKKAARGGDADAVTILSQGAEKKKQLKNEKKALRREKKRLKKEKLKKSYLISAAGGYAGFFAGALALIAVILPVLIMNKAFPEIPVLYDNIEKANLYVSAYLSGSEVDLNDENVYGANHLAPRTLTFEPLEFEDASMFIVSSTSENNIYLKSWSGAAYDYANSSWQGADVDGIVSYRNKLGSGFDPGEITTAFKRYVYPSTDYITDPKVYENFYSYGFTMQSVMVERLSGTSRLLFIPSQFNTDRGLMELGTLSPVDIKYQSYYDGIYSTRFFGKGSAYSTVSYVPIMSASGLAAELSNAKKYYDYSVKAILENLECEDTDALLYEYETYLEENGITYIGTSIADRYFNTMSEAERAEFISSAEKEKLYGEYARETHLATTGSESIALLADSILAIAKEKYGESPTTHQLMLTLVEYLRDNYEYTLTPDKSLYEEDTNVLESFLFTVKQGYCTHFATAACQIVREWGIPARYCEGYLASEFYTSFQGYSTEILDSDAHAWIEIYVDGMGWMQYEVTPPYLEDMYDPDNATQVEIEDTENETPSVNQTLPEFDAPEKEYAEDELAGADEQMSEVEMFVTVIVCVAILVVIFLVGRFLIKLFVRRGTNMLFERYRLIDRAKDEAIFKDPKADKRKMARSIDDQIIAIFAAIGAAPEKGELSRDYGKRLKESYGDLSSIDPSEVFDIIQKEEFGGGLDYKELCVIAEYLADITVSVYAGLGPVQKIILRYIKRII